jgi:hypothetical protein
MRDRTGRGEMTTGKEVRVKPPSGAEQHRGRRAETRVGPLEGLEGVRSAGVRLAELSDAQVQVLECLQKAGTGLTVGQLRSRVSFPTPALKSALTALVEGQLVARLNTLIPSYVYRYPGVRVHDE